MDFIYLFRVLLKRKWLIIGAAIIAAVIAWYFTRDEKKFYRSRAQISTGYAIPNDIKVNDVNSSIFEADTKFNNAIVTITSPSVLNLLGYSLVLHDLKDPKPFRHLTPEEQQSSTFKQIDKSKAEKVFSEKLIRMNILNSYDPEEKKLLEYLNLYGYGYKSLSQLVSVYRLERTDYIQIDGLSENPELSAFIVNNLYEQFYRYYRTMRSSNSQESLDTLRSIMDKKQKIMNDKNTQYAAQGGTIDIDLVGGSKLDQITQLEQDLSNERSRRITLNSELDKVNLKLKNIAQTPTTQNSFVNNNELIVLRKQMNDAYKDYLSSGSSNAVLLDNYNRLKNQYQAKYNELSPSGNQPKQKDGLMDELIDQKNGIEIDIHASDQKINGLASRINMLKGNVQYDASKGAMNEGLKNETELATKEYLEAKQKYNDGLSINTSSVNNFKQVLFGQPAIDPEPSKRKLIVGMAGVAAGLTTMFIIILLAYLDSSLKTPVIFAKTVDLKMISMVNFMNFKQKKLEDIITNNDNPENSIEKLRNNVFRESLRKLRYEVESTGKKIFLFTSTKKGQGKTTLIQALSFSLGVSKKKILIIDTNFCNNDLTVQLEATPVLEKISTTGQNGNAVSFLDQIRSNAKEVSNGNGTVFAIGSEGGDYTPSEILPRENILHHLQDLKEEYDFIFLEGPPLNDFSDSKELSTYVEGVIGVFSATNIIKQIDKESISFFKDLDGKFCGAILNMVDMKNVNVV